MKTCPKCKRVVDDIEILHHDNMCKKCHKKIKKTEKKAKKEPKSILRFWYIPYIIAILFAMFSSTVGHVMSILLTIFSIVMGIIYAKKRNYTIAAPISLALALVATAFGFSFTWNIIFRLAAIASAIVALVILSRNPKLKGNFMAIAVIILTVIDFVVRSAL